MFNAIIADSNKFTYNLGIFLINITDIPQNIPAVLICKIKYFEIFPKKIHIEFPTIY